MKCARCNQAEGALCKLGDKQYMLCPACHGTLVIWRTKDEHLPVIQRLIEDEKYDEALHTLDTVYEKTREHDHKGKLLDWVSFFRAHILDRAGRLEEAAAEIERKIARAEQAMHRVSVEPAAMETLFGDYFWLAHALRRMGAADRAATRLEHAIRAYEQISRQQGNVPEESLITVLAAYCEVLEALGRDLAPEMRLRVLDWFRRFGIDVDEAAPVALTAQRAREITVNENQRFWYDFGAPYNKALDDSGLVAGKRVLDDYLASGPLPFYARLARETHDNEVANLQDNDQD